MMSWNFAVHQINKSFDQIAVWYKDFMQRTETSFQALHERIKYLEQRQAQLDDEQLERVLRKILAEKFGDPRAGLADGMRNGTFVLNRPGDALAPKPVSIDAAELAVDVDSMPSKGYRETFKMLQSGLRSFPDLDGENPSRQDGEPDSKPPGVPK